MSRHLLDGNAIAADAHYCREDVEMRACDQCDGTGTHLRDEHDTGTRCNVCGGSGEVPVEPEEYDVDYEYERRRDAAMDRG